MKITLFNSEIIISKGKLILFIGAAVIAIALGVFGFIKLGSEDKVFIGKASSTQATGFIETSSTATTITLDKAIETKVVVDEIKIYIVGCVKNEGIVTLKKGQIINDAVILAGGLTKDADRQNINLAYILTENVMIKIKSKKEILNENKLATSTKTQLSNSTPIAGSGVEIVKNSGGVVSNEIIKESNKTGKININTATLKELDTLPRIGEKTANDIISHREKTGGFKKIEDLMEVPRIGEKTFADLKDLIDIK